MDEKYLNLNKFNLYFIIHKIYMYDINNLEKIYHEIYNSYLFFL